MKEYKIKRQFRALVGKPVAVIFKDGTQLWGIVDVFPAGTAKQYAIKTFKGKYYLLDSINVSFIDKLRCEPHEIQY